MRPITGGGGGGGGGAGKDSKGRQVPELAGTGRGLITFYPHTGSRQLEPEVGQSSEPSKPTASEGLPSAKKFYVLKVP